LDLLNKKTRSINERENYEKSNAPIAELSEIKSTINL